MLRPGTTRSNAASATTAPKTHAAGQEVHEETGTRPDDQAIPEPNTRGGARRGVDEYSPAYFSNLTLDLTRGAGGRAATPHLRFSVIHALTTKRRR